MEAVLFVAGRFRVTEAGVESEVFAHFFVGVEFNRRESPCAGLVFRPEHKGQAMSAALVIGMNGDIFEMEMRRGKVLDEVWHAVR